MKKKSIYAAGALLALGVTAFLVLQSLRSGRSEAQSAAEEPQTAATVKAQVAEKKPAAVKPKPPRKRHQDPLAKLSPEQRKAVEKIMRELSEERETTEEEDRQIEALEAAAEAEKHDEILKLAAAAETAQHADVREAAVKALAQLGEDGMDGLVGFLDDPDEAVRMEAEASWTDILINLEDENDKAELIAAAMCDLEGEEVLGPIAAQLNELKPSEAYSVIEVVEAYGTESGKAIATRMRDAIADEDTEVDEEE